MRILTGIDVPFLPFGGSLICCDNWYSDTPQDVDVRFLTLHNSGHERWWSMSDVIMMDVEKARTPQGFADYVARLETVIRQHIDDFKPDVIHCQHLNYGLSRAFANIKTTIPRIGICHGTDVQAATTHPFFGDNLTRICDAMDTLVFPNQTMYKDFTALYNRPKDIRISPLGIPDEFFAEHLHTPRFAGRGTLRVLYAGRLLDWKGPDIAVGAMAFVKHDLHLTVIGNEDQKDYLTTLRTSVKKQALSNKVTFMPQLPRNELLEAFSAFDVIVFPSRQLEAFSLTVVEAQAKGLPVIFNPGGGIADTVGSSGIRLSECSPQHLAKTLDTLYEQPELLAHYQARGFINAAQYKLSASRQRLFDLSAELMQRGADRMSR